MMKPLLGAPMLPLALVALVALGGCGEESNPAPTGGPGAGFPGPPPGGPEGAGASPGIKQIMTKLTKGPNSLTEVLGRELNEAQPPWETIQGQTKEYAEQAADLAKYDPPKGSKESWAKLTAAYAESAVELDKAAQAKDKDSALAAHGEIKSSCMACHREHRQMGRGMGGFPGGGPRGGFGGPPPGGPPGGSPPPPPGGEPPK